MLQRAGLGSQYGFSAISGEERVSCDRHSLLFESRLNDANYIGGWKPSAWKLASSMTSVILIAAMLS